MECLQFSGIKPERKRDLSSIMQVIRNMISGAGRTAVDLEK